ncbi:Alginate_exp domain-containing protein [Hyphomicrobiales bacterium]|nr:Alginate_exp domain-containing protein [Hyphomicrobiales bacterium]CAH1697338.1 Alginate_exp domain-containing protein [Hyphomicrobiales bacterium]CAI0345524.1 Alginate_exp domain-containing protein [Hyphomicrobiales bacterium]
MRRWRAVALAGACWLTLAGAAAAQADKPGDTPQTDPFDRLKDIPLTSDGAVTLSLGGQLRLRPEFSRHPVFGLAAPEHNNGLLLRSFLSADLRLGPYLRGFVQFASGQAPIWTGTPPGTQLDRLDLQQGYGELTLPAVAGSLMIRGGRQEMSFGSSRLVSVRDSPNIRRAFDGVRAAWIVAPDSRIDAFLVRPVVPLAGIFDDRSDPAQAFWGVYGTSAVPGIPALKADLYYLGINREKARFAQGTADEHRHTVGARLFGKLDSFDWNLEGAYQFGRFGSADIRAWMASAVFGYSFAELPLAPRIGLNADAFSGDHNLSDGTLGTFNPLYPRLPYFSEANLVGPANLMSLQPNLTLTLLPKVKLTLGWNPLWKQAEADAYYGPTIMPVARTAGGAGRYLGHQLSTTLEWSPAEHLTFGGTHVAYEPGERIRRAGGVSGSFTAGWATVSF